MFTLSKQIRCVACVVVVVVVVVVVAGAGAIDEGLCSLSRLRKVRKKESHLNCFGFQNASKI